MVDKPAILSELGSNHTIAISLILSGKPVYLVRQCLVLILLGWFIRLCHSGLTDNLACPMGGNIKLIFYLFNCLSLSCQAQ